MVLLIKVKDRYFNYENINQFDFIIYKRTEPKPGEDPHSYFLNVGSVDKTIAEINMGSKENWERAKKRLEHAIIFGFRFIDLLEEDEEEND